MVTRVPGSGTKTNTGTRVFLRSRGTRELTNNMKSVVAGPGQQIFYRFLITEQDVLDN